MSRRDLPRAYVRSRWGASIRWFLMRRDDVHKWHRRIREGIPPAIVMRRWIRSGVFVLIATTILLAPPLVVHITADAAAMLLFAPFALLGLWHVYHFVRKGPGWGESLLALIVLAIPLAGVLLFPMLSPPSRHNDAPRPIRGR